MMWKHERKEDGMDKIRGKIWEMLNKRMDSKRCKERRIRQMCTFAAAYEVTLNPIDFYSSTTVNHQRKTASVSLCIFV